MTNTSLQGKASSHDHCYRYKVSRWLPAGFWLIFVVLLTAGASAQAASPQIRWASDPISPGDTAMIIGESFGKHPKVSIHRLADTASSQGSADTAAEIRQASDTTLKITIPSTFAPGQYAVKVSTGDGSAEVTLNAPTVYWSRVEIGPDEKGVIRVLGRNIARTGKATLLLTDKSGKRIVLPAAGTDMWDGHFPVAAAIPNGEYAASLWNGPQENARNIGTMSINAPAAPSARVITVPARGANKSDDTSRINDALAGMARAGGGTVRLTRGTLNISATLIIPPKVELQGMGEDLTFISLGETATPPDVLISGTSDFSISNLSIAARRHNHIIAGGFADNRPIAGAQNIHIDKVRIRASMYYGHLTPDDISERLKAAMKWSTGGPDAIRLSGSNVSVTNSDILSSGRSLYLNSARDSRIANNKLYNGRYGWYSISISSNLIFEGNSITGADMQSTGGGINTLFATGQPLSRNIIFKGNSFIRLMGWDREAMTSDGPGGCYAGPAELDKSADHRLHLPGADPAQLAACIGGDVIFLAGGARGSVHRITGLQDGGLTMDTAPSFTDSNTRVVVGPAQENYLIVGNHFEDTGALQFFGTSVNHVIADNTFDRSDGIFLRALKYKELQPVLYVQIFNNTILSAPVGNQGQIQMRTQPPGDASFSLVIGVVIRGNKLQSNSSIQIMTSDNAASGIEDVLIEGNSIAQSDIGIAVDRFVSGILLSNNLFEDVRTRVNDKSA